MKTWLINQTTIDEYYSLAAKGITIPDQVMGDVESRSNLRYTRRGNTAYIPVTGVLTENVDIMAIIFGMGNTTYPSIISAIARAENDPDVNEVVFDINSPGGQAGGWYDVAAAIQGMKKPKRTYARGMVASAAYAIASQTDSITASNAACVIGSIGTATTMYADGPDEFTLASSDAPNKRPDPRTEEGRSVVRAELDEFQGIFIEAVAQGRNTTVDNVKATYGKGGTFLAEKALSVGMIDGIDKMLQNKDINSSILVENKIEEPQVDLKTLQKEHSDVFAEALQLGAEKERNRVNAHLKAGEACGDTSIALSAIAEGASFEDKQSDYFSASLLAHAKGNRVEDNKEIESSTNEDFASEEDFAKEVAKSLGVNV